MKSVEKQIKEFAPVNFNYIENQNNEFFHYENFDGFGSGQNMSIPMGPQGGNMFMGINNKMKNNQNMEKEWMKLLIPGVQEMPMGQQGGNMFMGMNNIMENFKIMDKEWMKGFNLGVQEVAGSQKEDDGRPIVNVTFETTKGLKTNIILPLNITIDQALEKYLKKVGHDELYAQKSNKIKFLVNAAYLEFGDQRKLSEVFGMNNKNPRIIVFDKDEI